jgi:hypothetical protein
MNPQKFQRCTAARLVSLAIVLLSPIVTPLAAGAASGTFAVTGSMNTPRTGHTATLLQSGEVLVAGGADLNGPLTSSELYNPATGTWSLTGSMVFTHNSGFTATLLPSGEVLVAGGLDSSTEFCLSEAELYNPSTGRWTSTGSMTQPRCGHTAYEQTGHNALFSRFRSQPTIIRIVALTRWPLRAPRQVVPRDPASTIIGGTV